MTIGSVDGVTWNEYNFWHKPGDISVSPRWIAPYQARLDWQMWFAALGSPSHNIWFINLIAKLLEGSTIIPSFINTGGAEMNDNTFVTPRYVRTSLYHYDFTHYIDYSTTGSSNGKNANAALQRNDTSQWYWRRYEREYLPSITSDAPMFNQVRQHLGIGRHPCRDMNSNVKKARKRHAKQQMQPKSSGNGHSNGNNKNEQSPTSTSSSRDMTMDMDYVMEMIITLFRHYFIRCNIVTATIAIAFTYITA
jgi:hypothetical protein